MHSDDYIPILSRADGEAQGQRTPHSTTERSLSDRELARLQRDTAEVPTHKGAGPRGSQEGRYSAGPDL